MPAPQFVVVHNSSEEPGASGAASGEPGAGAEV